MFENKYPYTDFHELNLDWFLAEFKKVHDHVDQMQEQVDGIDALVHKFTEFVTNYFNNLDVQQEINNKLDALVEDGTLGKLLQPYFNELVANVNATILSQNGRIATLEGRMDKFSSLTEGSTTGDAELMDIRVGANGITYNTAGDAVRGQYEELQDEIDEVFVYEQNDLPQYVLGLIDTTGVLVNSNKGVAFQFMIPVCKGSTVYVDSGYKYRVALYNMETGALISRSNWKTYEETYTFTDNNLCRLVIADTSESEQADTSISEHFHLNLYSNIYVKTNIHQLYFQKSCNIDLNYDKGDVVNLNPSSIVSYRCSVSDCSENDVIIINAKGGNNPRVWAFLDKDNKLISKATPQTASVVQTNLIVVAPKDAAKVVLNDQNTNQKCYSMGLCESNRYLINQMYGKYADNDDLNEILDQTNNVVNTLGLATFVDKMQTVCFPNAYSAWPFVGALSDKAVCVYSRGTSHNDNTTPILYAKTSKNGVIWTNEVQIVEYEGYRNTVTGKGNNSDGDLIIWNRVGNPSANPTYDLYKTSDGVNFEKVSHFIPLFATGHIGDIISVPGVGLMCFFNTFGTNRTWGVLTSADDGETWTQTSIESGITGSEVPTEISPVYLGDGKILAMGRKDVEASPYNMFQIESSDYGKTWTKSYTNINDIYSSTPSIIYDNTNLTLYYYVRGTGQLKRRIATPTTIWNNPTAWPDSTVIAEASTHLSDAGNANACIYNGIKICSFYSGNGTTGIYDVIEQ